MPRLEIDDPAEAHTRWQDTIRAQRHLTDCLSYLHAARAPAALRRARTLKKSMQGAVNHARARYMAAARKSRGES